MPSPSTIIIGAGIGGLATAIRLAVKGHAVQVMERNAYPGGKLAEEWLGPYRFDAGPSLFTLPRKVDELFELAGENPRVHFNYRRLDTVCRYFYEDGTRLTASGEPEQFAAEIESVMGADRRKVMKYLRRSRELYELTAPVFIDRPFGEWQTLFSKPFLKGLGHLGKMDVFRSLHQANHDELGDPRLVQLFDRYATYNGSDPYQAPATLKVIPALEYFYGAYLPDGGMYAIPRSLAALAERLGVKFHFNTPVNRILHEGKKVTGIETSRGRMQADYVICNGDVFYMYDKLLPDLHPPQKIIGQERSSSALVFNWGIRQSFPELDLHNIFFAADYQAEFRTLFTDKEVYHDPTAYVFISSKYLPGDAPPGHENWFVLVNAPPHTGQDWASVASRIRPLLVSKLSRLLNTDIAPLIEQEWILDPRQIELRTSSYRGSLYGTSSNSRWAAFNRHPNRSAQLKGLYFTGGSVHPGGGIPLCLSSANIVASLIPASNE